MRMVKKMKKSNFIYDGSAVNGIKHWTKGVGMEPQALQQLINVANMPFIHKHVAAMPDVHFGRGATIGSVIATKGAIIPSAVGVDIGCGMIAVQTTLKAGDLPDNLRTIRNDIERAVPHGFVSISGRSRKGSFEVAPQSVLTRWRTLSDGYETLVAKHGDKIAKKNPHEQLGTLGGGNHFIEICLDENDSVWIMLHSGSRGAGNLIGQYFIDKAKEDMERRHIGLVDRDLSYLTEGDKLFEDYTEALLWAQDYAYENRQAMLDNVLGVLRNHLKPFQFVEQAINCHHNYASQEVHFGENVWVTRKGAVRAQVGDLGIIPGSMGTGSFIVRGLGSKESFCSCSHGAGRVMSRGEAKRTITMADHEKATAGIECRKDKAILDESPAAYKDISAVMAAQDDLVEVVHRLRQVVNVKG